ncbi:hypothetical protein PLICRDRAFT_164856 [Plicaturopsis crispa FD-325 SS-3]|nr:hypothetical protein PLICRDRAFT_164856 [Plicaturopsis crispa FD-325 SS-3]
MPPRKKPADSDADASNPPPTRATRSSARIAAKPVSDTSAAAAAPATSSKPPSKTATKPPSKTAATSASKTAVAKPAAKTAAKPPSKTAAKPASKAAAKPASKTAAKPASKRSRSVAAGSDSEDDAAAPPVKKSKKSKAKAKVEDIPEEDEEEDDSKDDVKDVPQKMVTVLKRGAAPVDPNSSYVQTHQVYAGDGEVWDAMLNQTNIGNNANKFYVIQLLHPIGKDSQVILFTRWGRVGERGQSQTKGPFPPSVAISEFKKQFKAKAATNWEERKGMVAKKGKYMWLERTFEDEEADEKPKSKRASGSKDVAEEDEDDDIVPDSVLAPEIQVLCRMIFSTTLMSAALSSMNYDANKLPLGKLAKSTILNGFAALKAIAEALEKPDGDVVKSHGGSVAKACEELSEAYYSIIPHDFGRNRPVAINNIVALKKELELVDALGDMEIAQKLITGTVQKDAVGRPINPLDAHFRSLGLSSMDPVARSSAEFAALEAYARDTHGATHSHFRVDVQNAFRVERQHETQAWLKSGFDKLPDGDRLLLWHGSRSTNFAGILSQGLRIAPPEAPVTGYMFGKGVYFADMMSKSANYCYSHMSDNTGLLLLCEVAAKPFHEEMNSNYNADQACKANKKLVTKGCGRTQPAKWKDAGMSLGNPELAGCHMPDGPGQDMNGAGFALQYNEYIAYDVSQIRLRYLLMVKMG